MQPGNIMCFLRKPLWNFPIDMWPPLIYILPSASRWMCPIQASWWVSRGSASAKDINTLAEGVVEQDLLGIMVWYCRSGTSPHWGPQASIHKYIMVWYCSVRNGFQYEADWDCRLGCRWSWPSKDNLILIYFLVRRVRKRSSRPWSLFPAADEVKLRESGVFIFFTWNITLQH